MSDEWKYYSQGGEDCLLARLFDEKPDGFFVDVGAFDGVHISNSYTFEKAGWQGICVEANPKIYELCAKNRPGTLCLNCACVGNEDTKNIEFMVEPLGLLSGIDPDAKDVKKRYRSRGLEFNGLEKVEVPAKTLNQILGDHLPEGREIDFLSIDVEGAEMDVLAGLDLKRYAPRVIIMEANTQEHHEELRRYLVRQHGYSEARKLTVNIFFARDEQDAKKLAELPVDCMIEPTMHPLGEEYTFEYAKTRRHLYIEPEQPKGLRGLWQKAKGKLS